MSSGWTGYIPSQKDVQGWVQYLQDWVQAYSQSEQAKQGIQLPEIPAETEPTTWMDYIWQKAPDAAKLQHLQQLEATQRIAAERLQTARSREEQLRSSLWEAQQLTRQKVAEAESAFRDSIQLSHEGVNALDELRKKLMQMRPPLPAGAKAEEKKDDGWEKILTAMRADVLALVTAEDTTTSSSSSSSSRPTHIVRSGMIERRLADLTQLMLQLTEAQARIRKKQMDELTFKCRYEMPPAHTDSELTSQVTRHEAAVAHLPKYFNAGETMSTRGHSYAKAVVSTVKAVVSDQPGITHARLEPAALVTTDSSRAGPSSAPFQAYVDRAKASREAVKIASECLARQRAIDEAYREKIKDRKELEQEEAFHLERQGKIRQGLTTPDDPNAVDRPGMGVPPMGYTSMASPVAPQQPTYGMYPDPRSLPSAPPHESMYSVAPPPTVPGHSGMLHHQVHAEYSGASLIHTAPPPSHVPSAAPAVDTSKLPPPLVPATRIPQ